jgi:hypothetical protein
MVVETDTSGFVAATVYVTAGNIMLVGTPEITPILVSNDTPCGSHAGVIENTVPFRAGGCILGVRRTNRPRVRSTSLEEYVNPADGCALTAIVIWVEVAPPELDPVMYQADALHGVVGVPNILPDTASRLRPLGRLGVTE